MAVAAFAVEQPAFKSRRLHTERKRMISLLVSGTGRSGYDAHVGERGVKLSVG